MFAHLKPGDAVVIVGRYGYQTAKIGSVTPTQIVTEGGSCFRRKNGKMVGNTDWVRVRISVDPADFLRARAEYADRQLHRGFLFTRAGVMKARVAADFAEAVLREMGKWDGEPAPVREEVMARKIASAPALYDALKAVTAWQLTDAAVVQVGIDPAHYRAAFDRARAVLAAIGASECQEQPHG